MTDTMFPGEHPHSDRPNWQPAETLDDYLTNCREGLEDYSQKRAAKLLGISRVELWRWQRVSSIPEDLFERFLAAGHEAGRMPSTRELANVGAALEGRTTGGEVDRCPCCGYVLRVRGRWSKASQEVIDQWLRDQAR